MVDRTASSSRETTCGLRAARSPQGRGPSADPDLYKGARRVTVVAASAAPRPPTPPPAPAPEPATDDDESYDEFGPGAKVVAPASDGCVYQATVVKAYKKALRVQWEDGATASAPREERAAERAPAPRITEEDKRERRREQQELRAMAQHDKPALLLMERRAMGMQDKPLSRGRRARVRAAGRAPRLVRTGPGLHRARPRPAMRARQEDRERRHGAVRRTSVVFLSSRFGSRQKRGFSAAPSRAGACGRSEGGDYVGAGGATGAVAASCTDAALD